MDRYPVDDIRDRTNCELHQSMKNIHEGGSRLCFTLWTWSTMACPWDSSWLCLCRGGWSCTKIWLLELDIPGTEGEVTLGEVLGGIILWEKIHHVSRLGAKAATVSSESSQFTTSKSTFYNDRDDHHNARTSRSPPPTPTHKSHKQYYGKAAAPSTKLPHQSKVGWRNPRCCRLQRRI
jgi:hypothetical protein